MAVLTDSLEIRGRNALIRKIKLACIAGDLHRLTAGINSISRIDETPTRLAVERIVGQRVIIVIREGGRTLVQHLSVPVINHGARGKRYGRRGGALGGIYALGASRYGKDMICVLITVVGAADFRQPVGSRRGIPVRKRGARAVRTAQCRDAAVAVVFDGQRIAEGRRRTISDRCEARTRIAERNPVRLDGSFIKNDIVQDQTVRTIFELDRFVRLEIYDFFQIAAIVRKRKQIYV